MNNLKRSNCTYDYKLSIDTSIIYVYNVIIMKIDFYCYDLNLKSSIKS